MSGQNADKWQQVADLISRLGLAPRDQDVPRIAAAVNRMSTRHLLKDPMRAAIYQCEWDDRTADVEPRLRSQPPTANHKHVDPRTRPSQPQPQRVPPKQQQAARLVRAPSPVTPREPTPAPGPSGTASTPMVKTRTAAQQAKNRRKFQALKEKKLARERLASQQHRLAKQPELALEPGAACEPTSKPEAPVAMEVDLPSTTQKKPTIDPDTYASNAWLASPGLSLEGLPEMEYDRPFFTPVGSPNRR